MHEGKVWYNLQERLCRKKSRNRTHYPAGACGRCWIGTSVLFAPMSFLLLPTLQHARTDPIKLD